MSEERLIGPGPNNYGEGWDGCYPLKMQLSKPQSSLEEKMEPEEIRMIDVLLEVRQLRAEVASLRKELERVKADTWQFKTYGRPIGEQP